MPLINLLQDCSKVFGDNIADPAAKNVLLADVNTAAQRLWDDYDLVGSIREETVQTDVTEGLQVLPWYMNRVRMCKIHSTRQPITLVSQEGFYQTYAYFQSPFTIRVASPCTTTYNLDIATQITVKLLAAELKKTEVTIVGNTSAGLTVSETLVFNPGETSKTTTNQFSATGNNPVRDALKSVTRSTLTSSDTAVYDLSGRLISFIPARRYTAEFTIFQLFDQLRFIIDQGYDILFKLPYPYFTQDADSLVSDIYNEAIYYKFIANRYRRTREAEGMDLTRAHAADMKCAEIVNSVTTNIQGPVETKLDMGTNRWHNLIRPAYSNNRGFGPYNDAWGSYGAR